MLFYQKSVAVSKLEIQDAIRNRFFFRNIAIRIIDGKGLID